MPNNCSNTISVFAKTRKELEVFKKKFCKFEAEESVRGRIRFEPEAVGIDFDQIIPTPKTQEECQRDFPNYVIHDELEAKKHALSYDGDDRWFNWYDWHCDFWGTKWNAYDQDVNEEDSKVLINGEEYFVLNIYFFTAWSPAEPIFDKLIELYPEHDIIFKFSYYEPGNWFAGRITWNPDTCEYDREEPDDDEGIKAIAIEEGYDDCEWMDEETVEDAE